MKRCSENWWVQLIFKLSEKELKPDKRFNKRDPKPPLLDRRFNHISTADPTRAMGVLHDRRSFCTTVETNISHRRRRVLSLLSSGQSMKLLAFTSREKSRQMRSNRPAFPGSTSRKSLQKCSWRWWLLAMEVAWKQNDEEQDWVAVSTSHLKSLCNTANYKYQYLYCYSGDALLCSLRQD